MMSENIRVLPPLPDFGNQRYPSALVTVTNACNLRCAHCFVYREQTPNDPRDKIADEVMLHQLRYLRNKHGIRSMLFMGGEPMIRVDLVKRAMTLFESSAMVTNGTYGIPTLPGHLVTVSLDGPAPANDRIRGEGVFEKVKASIFQRDPGDGTTVMLQMAVTRQNAPYIEEFVQAVEGWPIDGIAFTLYVPASGDESELAWPDLKARDEVVDRLIALKAAHPIVKANPGALALMKSDRCLEITGSGGANCPLKRVLPLYVGADGRLERTFCCYGNNVDCSRCGAYAVFNAAYRSRIA